MRLSELTSLLGGRLIGADREIKGVATVEEAGPDDLSFLANPKYKAKALASQAGALIVAEELPGSFSQIIAANPYLAFTQALTILNPVRKPQPGIAAGAHVCAGAMIDPSASVMAGAYIGEGATIAADVIIWPGCFVGDGAQVGARTVLNPNVTVYHGCQLGADCIVHAGVVIGSDGFGFVWDGQQHRKIPQVGVVIVGNNVEIGANCTVDRAALSQTVIGDGTKIDNLVQVAHNVVIGDNCLLVAQCGIAGSTKLGKNVTIAGQAGVLGHITLGDWCVASAKSGVAGDLEAGKVVSGYPAFEHRRWLRAQQSFKDLPDLLKRIRELERKVDELSQD